MKSPRERLGWARTQSARGRRQSTRSAGRPARRGDSAALRTERGRGRRPPRGRSTGSTCPPSRATAPCRQRHRHRSVSHGCSRLCRRWCNRRGRWVHSHDRQRLACGEASGDNIMPCPTRPELRAQDTDRAALVGAQSRRGLVRAALAGAQQSRRVWSAPSKPGWVVERCTQVLILLPGYPPCGTRTSCCSNSTRNFCPSRIGTPTSLNGGILTRKSDAITVEPGPQPRGTQMS